MCRDNNCEYNNERVIRLANIIHGVVMGERLDEVKQAILIVLNRIDEDDS